MVDATISAGTRSALFALSSMQSQVSVMENRLATGKKVNAPTDNAISYFLSAGLSSRANAINGLMSDIANTQGSIAAANNGITAIRAFFADHRADHRQPSPTIRRIPSGESNGLTQHRIRPDFDDCIDRRKRVTPKGG